MTIPKTENRKPKTVLVGLLCLLLLAAACGKKMTPYAPDRVLPAPVREFRLAQEGDSLVVSWLLPRENLLGQPLTQVQGCRVYRAAVKGLTPEALGSADFVLYADIDLAYPQRGEVQGEAMLFRDRELAPDHRYYYRVAAYDQDGYLGGWSKTLSHAWGWLPRTPGEFKAVPGDKIVALSWSPVTTLQDGSPARDLAGYVIYRLSGTGTEGATLRVYLERFVADPKAHDLDPQVALGEIITIARDLSDLETRTGREEPTVIT